MTFNITNIRVIRIKRINNNSRAVSSDMVLVLDKSKSNDVPQKKKGTSREQVPVPGCHY